MYFISAEDLSNYVQAMIDVARLGNLPIHQNDNALLVVGAGITFTKTETDDQKPAWSIAQVRKQLSPTHEGVIQVSNDLWATVTNCQELETAFTNLLLQIHVRRARFYTWYMKTIRPQHSKVPPSVTKQCSGCSTSSSYRLPITPVNFSHCFYWKQGQSQKKEDR